MVKLTEVGETFVTRRFPDRPAFSVVVPLFDEEDNVDLLCDRLSETLATLDHDWEVIFINDGSTDGTAARVSANLSRERRFRLVDFKRNFGQTAAIMAGIDHAQGDIIVPMDGDLQNDPSDIALLIGKLDEGYDVVSGWRRNRQDASLRVWPSRVANWLISMISGVHLHDYGCTMKAYRREVLQGFRLYGEMHRFVPIFARWEGAKVIELPVTHHPRLHGRSKYGLNRIFKVVLDLMVVKFLTQYQAKPIYVFGGIGFFFIGLATVAALYAAYLKLFDNLSLIQTPLPLMAMFGFMMGFMCVLLGLLAEVLVRIYFESQDRPNYTVKSVSGLGLRTRPVSPLPTPGTLVTRAS